MKTPRTILGLAATLSLSFGLAAVTFPLRADDLAFHEVGARAASLGGAFTALANDVTAIYYNPAGLAFLDGLRFKTNVVFAGRNVDAYWAPEARTFTSHDQAFLMNGFLSWQPAKRVSLGLGYFSPYNFRTLWDHPLWIADDMVISSDLEARTVRAVLAVEPLKGLALGAAVDYVSTSVNWNNNTYFEMPNYYIPPETLVDTRHNLSGHGWGLTASALWKVFPALQIGARYQKSVALDLKGANQFLLLWDHSAGFVPDPYWPRRAVSEILEMFFVPQHVTGRITLPQETALGVVLRPVPRLSLHFDMIWDKWSEFGAWEFSSVNSNETLAPDFTADYQEFWGVTPSYAVMGAPLTLQDSRKLKAGLEFQIGRWFHARTGFARNESSVAPADLSPVYPDLARTSFSFGVGYEGPIFSFYDNDDPVGELSIDLVVRYIGAETTASTLPGLELSYSAKGWSAGIGVGFGF